MMQTAERIIEIEIPFVKRIEAKDLPFGGW